MASGRKQQFGAIGRTRRISRRRFTAGALAVGAGATLGRSTDARQAQPDQLSGKLSVSVWGNKQDVASQQAAMNKFQQLHPGVKINLTQGDCGVDFAACKTLIAGGTMPDVIVPGIWNYNAMVDANVLEGLDAYIERDKLNLADFNHAVINGVKALKDGKMYGLPMGFNIQSLFYNKDMFDKAGLSYPPADGSYTWQDVRAWAKKLTLDEGGNNGESSNFDPKKIKQWGFTTLAVTNGDAAYDPVLLAFGGSAMTLPDRQKCNLENPDSIRAWQFLQDMMYTDHSTVTPDVNQEQLGYLRWVTGQVAMQQGSHEQVALVNTQNPTMKFDMAALPKEKAGNATCFQVHIWSIYKGSKNKDLAWELVKWLATDGSIAGAPDRPAAIMELIPAYKDYALGEAFLKAPKEPEHLKQAQLDPTAWPLTVYPTADNQKHDEIVGQDGFGPAMTDIMNNKKTAAAALSGISKKIDAIMSQ